MLKKNSFPTTLVEKCVKIFLNRTFEQKIVKHTVPKKDSFTLSWYVFPVFENTLTKSINRNISFCKINIIFRSSKWLAIFFRFKKILLCLCSIIVLKFACGRCDATYHSESCRRFKVRVSEHSGISLLMNKPSKSKKSTAVKDHMLMQDQLVSLDNIKL